MSVLQCHRGKDRTESRQGRHTPTDTHTGNRAGKCDSAHLRLAEGVVDPCPSQREKMGRPMHHMSEFQISEVFIVLASNCKNSTLFQALSCEPTC
ncbi:hypothetical protein ILYODFUR_002907 [Ilyodon furcidens]|uniref:Uncharacterized protein n=1 Tax=Ilyodon furcidens TaxID=33524 RepID=A0ABV0SKH1_9TELE